MKLMKLKVWSAVVITLMGLFISQPIAAQITKYYGDSSLAVSVYAGILNTTAFRNGTSGIGVENSYSLRVGGKFAWEASPYMTVLSFIAYDRSAGKEIIINSFSVDLHNVSGQFGLELGYMATPSTESRPHPVSGDGHFETWSESRLPGGALGAKVYFLTEKGRISTGVGVRNNQPEYHLRYSTKNIDYGMSYASATKKFQIFGVVKTSRVYSLTAFENERGMNLVANFTNVTLSKKANVKAYFDCGYQITTNKFERLEFGVMKNFQVSYLKGLVALGYQHENKCINAYLFIYLGSPNK